MKAVFEEMHEAITAALLLVLVSMPNTPEAAASAYAILLQKSANFAVALGLGPDMFAAAARKAYIDSAAAAGPASGEPIH